MGAALWLMSPSPVYSQGGPGSRVIVPDSSIEQPWDVGHRAHTNHLIYNHVRFGNPQGGLGPGGGMTPAQIRSFYNLPSTGGSKAIAIVDAYHYPTALNDFNVFSGQFTLPKETSANPLASTNQVFQVVYASGRQPRTDSSWALEAALDIEWAHAMAPSAKIVLVEAASNSFADLLAAVDKASQIVRSAGGGEVSMSWGGSEFSGETGYDSHFPTKTGVVYFAASGDTGGQTIWPGTSPYVVSAGGTSITTDKSGMVVVSETGWSGSGGGPSLYESIPSYQGVIANIVGSQRGAPDFSFDADPNTGVAVYDTTRYQGYKGWWVVGGTSAASPALAGIVNLASTSSGHFSSDSYDELTTIYSNLGNSNDFRDITSGSAGSYTAVGGWDFVTGVGSNLGLNGK